MKGILFALILGFFLFMAGCNGQTGPLSTPPELYGGNLFSEESVSVCKVISDSEIESLFGLNGKQLSHVRSGISITLSGRSITLATCSYEWTGQDHYYLMIKYANYSDKATYDFAVGKLPENDTGKVGNYDYVFYVNQYSEYVLTVKVPESNILIDFSTPENSQTTSKQKLVETAELFLSRVDPSKKSTHTFIPSSNNLATYSGSRVSFKYPENWVANQVHPVLYYVDEEISLEDPDGIILMDIFGTKTAMYLDQEDCASFITSLTPTGATLLYSSDTNEACTVIYNSNKSIIHISKYWKLNDSTSFVLGWIENEERYNFYKSEIMSVLESVRSVN